MKIIFFTFPLLLHCLESLQRKKIISKNYNVKGVYKIFNPLNNNYLVIDKNNNILFSNKNSYFYLIEIKLNSNYYLIKSKNKNKFLGIDEIGNILIYNAQEIFIEKIVWKITNINKKFVLIKNIYNNKFLEVNNIRPQCSHKINFNHENIDNNDKINKNFLPIP